MTHDSSGPASGTSPSVCWARRMRRVLVVGCPGTGKSTFSRRLRDVTGLPLHHLDLLWHKPDMTTVTTDEFDARLRGILEGDAWIIDSNYMRTLEWRLERCDTVYFLDVPTETCLAGVEARIGVRREDLPWVEREFDGEFRRYIIDFPRDCRPQLVHMLDDAARRGVRVCTLRSRDEFEAALADVRAQYG